MNDRFTSYTQLIVVTLLLVPASFVALTPAADLVRAQPPDEYAVTQAGQCTTVVPLGNGTQTVQDYYDYRSGETSPAGRFSSYGPTEQATATSNLYFYRGSDGVSLIVLHDRRGDEAGGGTVTFDVSGLPSRAEWVVEDDTYTNRDDVYDHRGSGSHVEWVWAPNRTDGAAIRSMGEGYDAITIAPGFNEDSVRWETWPETGPNHRITTWQFLSGDGSAVSLDMDQPVTISPGPCSSDEPQAPPNFQLSALDVPDSATQGDTVNVSATVENTGERKATRSVSLAVDGEDVDNRSVSRAPGASESLSFDLNTSGLAAGKHEVTVATDNDTATTQLTIEDSRRTPADFRISDLNAPSLATQGDTVNVSARVENVGDREATQTVRVTVDGDEVDNRSITLAGGETESVTFDLDTGSLDPREYDVTVATANDSETAQFSVEEPRQEPADFRLSTLDVPDSVTQGDTVTVSATVENAGEHDGSQSVSLAVDGVERQNQSVTLAASENGTVTFDLDTDDLDPGNYDVTVATANDSASTPFAIEERDDGGSDNDNGGSDDGGNDNDDGGSSGGGGGDTGPGVSQDGGLDIRDVTVDEANASVGSSVGIGVTVSNTDVGPHSRTFTLKVDGEAVDSRRVVVDGDQERTIRFAYAFDAAGRHQVSVGTQQTTVDVTPGAGTTPTTTTTTTATTTTTPDGEEPLGTTAAPIQRNGGGETPPAPVGGLSTTQLVSLGLTVLLGSVAVGAWILDRD